MKRGFLTIALLAGAVMAQAQDIAKSFKSTEVVPGIYMLEGDGGFAGGNISLLVGDERVVLIDDGLEPLAPVLIQVAADIARRPIDFIINTHVHLDHTGGNAALADTGAVVFAHDNIRGRMLANLDEYGGPDKLPLITFADSVTFHINGLEAFVFHIENAHTDGDAAIRFRDVNVIHAGDVMFNGIFPYIDLDNGGSVSGYIAGQQKIMALADENTIIIPGHGPLASKADLQVAVDMLIDAEAKVKALLDAGKTQEEILAANPLAMYHEKWNWYFITTEKMTQTLVRSLTSSDSE